MAGTAPGICSNDRLRFIGGVQASNSLEDANR
jgi:hypothetical protein